MLALVTVVLAGASVRAANAAKNAAETLPLLERAYVFFHDTKKRSTAKRYFVIFKNHGRTPAIVISRRINCDYFEIPPDPTSIPEHHFPHGAVIGSTTEWLRGIVEVTDEMIEKWQKGPGRIFLYGEIKYLDIFGKQRRTWFCRRYSNNEQFVLDDMTDPKLNGYN